MDKDNVPELIESMVKQASTQKNDQLVNYESDFAGDGISDLLQVLYLLLKRTTVKFFSQAL